MHSMRESTPLETTLLELRSAEGTAPPRTIFNQYHRQFLDQLRHEAWVLASKLPDTPRTKMALLRNGWIERRDTSAGSEYRITQVGLTEVCMPR